MSGFVTEVVMTFMFLVTIERVTVAIEPFAEAARR